MAASSSSVTSFEIEGSPAPPPRAAIPPPPPPPHYHSIDIPAPPPFESAIPPPPPPPQPMHAPQPLETAIPPPPPPPAPPAPENPVGGRQAESKLNSEQQVAFSMILDYIEKGEGGTFFIARPSRTGKIVLYCALLANVILKKLIALATATYGVAAPGGVVTDTPRNKSKSILAVVNRGAYDQYFTVLTVAMVVSVSGVACMVSGIPINRRIFVLLLRLITWVSLMAVVILHAISVTALTPIDIHGADKNILRLRYSLLALAGLMGLILVAHVIRLIAECRRGGADGEAAAA